MSVEALVSDDEYLAGSSGDEVPASANGVNHEANVQVVEWGSEEESEHDDISDGVWDETKYKPQGTPTFVTGASISAMNSAPTRADASGNTADADDSAASDTAHASGGCSGEEATGENPAASGTSASASSCSAIQQLHPNTQKTLDAIAVLEGQTNLSKNATKRLAKLKRRMIIKREISDGKRARKKQRRTDTRAPNISATVPQPCPLGDTCKPLDPWVFWRSLGAPSRALAPMVSLSYLRATRC
eukprot:SAG11_NODE_353_length_10348_cov_6.938335_14_plen_245_part_00